MDAASLAARVEQIVQRLPARWRAEEARTRVQQLVEDLLEARELPTLTVNMMLKRTADNDPFFAEIVRRFYDEARRPHPKLPLIRSLEWGVSLCILPRSFDAYFMTIEGAARRNFKKAQRGACRFSRIEMNDHLAAIGEIRRSTDTRQGQMPEDLLMGEVPRCTDPPTKTNVHDYPYFGVFQEDRLVAYACCLVAGEVCVLEHIFGHAAHLTEGVVPMMFIGIAEHIYKSYPNVRYYVYGTYFGALPKMRRFKKKFCFFPHRVDWRLDVRETAQRSG